MTDLAQLEAEIRVLKDIEAIKRLKHKYCRCIDTKLWDELIDCFSGDASAEYYRPEWQFHGAKAIVQWIREADGRDYIHGVHQCHNPEIDVTGDTTAKGVWALYSYSVDRQADRVSRFVGLYHDEYIKENGVWKIKSTKSSYIIREIWDRAPKLSTQFR